jgi:hypothetical protein
MTTVRPRVSTLVASLLALTLTGTSAIAQRPTAPTARIADRVCDMSAFVIALQLRDPAGTPIPDATIAVRRVRTRTLVDRAQAMGGTGDYMILEDGSMPDLRAAGEPFEVTFTKGSRTARARIVIGKDASGCHIRLLRGATLVTMR